MGLKAQSKKIDLMGRDVKLNEAMGIFITMNPNYAGSSNFPDKYSFSVDNFLVVSFSEVRSVSSFIFFSTNISQQGC